MKPIILSMIPLMAIGLVASVSARAGESQLSAEKLDMLDKRGYFTPAFKDAVHQYIDTNEAIVKTQADTKTLNDNLSDLQKQADEAKAGIDKLRAQLAVYAHPEDADFSALQDAMKNPNATTQDRLALAQAYVWTYPSDPHQVEAAQDMQLIEQQLAAQRQTVKQAAAARAAARAKLIQRAQAKDLSLTEWQDFLRDMSQEELLGYLGRPQTQADDYWIYTNGWTTDPVSGTKAGLQIDFSAGRVVSVSVAPR